MFWFLALSLTAMVLFTLVRPLVATSKPSGSSMLEQDGSDGDEEEAQQLRSALGGIDTAREAGLISEEEADEATLEAKRAALRLAQPTRLDQTSKKLRFAGVGFCALSPIFVALIYFTVGSPQALDPNAAIGPAPATTAETIAAMPSADRQAAIQSMVEGLARRLQDNPGDIAGWRMLARSYGVLGEFSKSASAYGEILDRNLGTREDFQGAIFALTKLHGEGGDPDGILIGVLEKMLASFPGDPLGLFQLGAVKRAAGDTEGAILLWRELLSSLPENAPIRSNLEQLIADARADIDANPQ